MTRTPKPPTPLLTTRYQTVPRRSEQGLDSGEQRPNIERRGGEEAVTWLRLSSAALRSSGTWLSAARRTTARLGRSMSTRAGSGVSCLKKARERRRATGGQNPSSGRRSRAPPPPPRETSGWREQERGARTWGWRSLFLFFLRRGVFDKGGGVRRCVREGETQAGEIKTYLTLGFGQGAARGGFMTMGCYAGRWGPEVRYPLLWLLLMTD